MKHDLEHDLKHDLAQLTRLQEIDRDLDEIEGEKGDLPEQLENLQREITQIKAKLTETENRFEAITLSIKEQRQAREDAKERLKKSQGILYSVKTTREYDAISSEIDQAKSQIIDRERQIIALQNEQTNLQKIRETQQEKLLTLSAEFDERSKEAQERYEQTHDEEDELRAERATVVARIKKPLYDHYNRIRKLREGTGVARLTGTACGYCFSTIPAQRIAEIHKQEDLILCEVCGCILVHGFGG